MDNLFCLQMLRLLIWRVDTFVMELRIKLQVYIVIVNTFILSE